MRNLSNTGVKFETIGDTSRRAQVVGYHGKPAPVDRSKAEQIDVNGLKPVDRQNVKIDGNEIESKFKIGMEFEKTRFNRGAVQEYPLLCGFETDSSCGVEAVTHILPLVAPSMWRTKVFNMFHEAKRIIDDVYSPSNSRCGGHITLSVDGMDGAELMARVRKFAPIVLAIFRKRLVNNYCSGNPQLLPMGEGVMSSGSSKYVVCKDTGFGIEFRIPSRFTSVKQTIRRYELMYHLLDFAVNKQDATMQKFYNTVKPILISMYEGNEDKAKAVIGLARHFAKFMQSGKVCKHVAPWLEGWWSRERRSIGRYSRHYKRGLNVNVQSVNEWLQARAEAPQNTVHL